MADALLNVVFENLNSLVQKEFGLLCGVNKEMEKLSSTLSTIRAVLADAEEKQSSDRAIKNWLHKLSDAAHVLDDVLDDCGMETSRLEYVRQNSRWEQKVCSFFLFHFDPMNSLFRRKIAKKMKEVGDRLDEIANERNKFHLNELIGNQRQIQANRHQTGSIVTQPQVYGREDKEKIVEFLVNETIKCRDIVVYPIVGMGGIGKTTLAQLIFNDARVSGNFELKLWVCVVQDFDLKRLMKAIIECSSGSTCEVLDMDPLQRRLQDMLRGKKFLLVLDDVWNEEQEQWDILKHVLACGSNGSSVLVTTRLKKVASIMGTIQMHHLSGLSEEDCWLLFKQRAFSIETEPQPKLVKIGKYIVRKCGGVPLAAKALGGLMRFKSEENEWISVMESELWNLSEDENSLLPALRLSYFNLPIEQRRCFAFCALFPKDSRIIKDRIIHLWMANGFISTKGEVEVEEIGNHIFNELHWRSFFEDYKKDYFGTWSFKMHNLVHDLAHSVMEDELHFMKLHHDSPITLPKRLRYLTCAYSHRPLNKIPSSQSLRTLMLLSMDCHTVNFNCDLNFPSLRAIDVEYFTITSISSLIKTTKHLRYLNLSYTDIRILPKSICNLQNLQTLHLIGCSFLQKLPKNLSCLRSLRHLNMFGCVQLSELPCNIGRLTCLRTLSMFIVGRRRGCHLEELQGLNLGGDLEIKGLEKVISPKDAEKANIIEKRNINKLCLYWGTEAYELKVNAVDEVLEALEPSPTLTILEIKNYKGVGFPHWLSNGILENVVSITLSNCNNCSQLPAFNKLPSLRYVYIHQMNLVQYVDNGSYDGDSLGGFMRLENLMIRNLPNLANLSRNEKGREEMFPCLSELYISHCYKLMMLPCIPSLKKLQLWKSNKTILNSISNLPGLISLGLHKFDDITSLPDQMLQNLTTLQILRISYIPNLHELPNDMLKGVNSIEKLHIKCCDELECLPDGIFQNPSCLKCISIVNCKKFKYLSESFQYLTALQSLDISGCPELEIFPNDLDHLSSLRHLTMSGHFGNYASQCSSPKMKLLPEALQHLPSLESMIISDFPNLTTLPDWLGNLTSLQELFIGNCLNLRSVPASIQQLTNLRKLSIQSCPKLQERCEKETGEDWHKITHIPNVSV
ncbi:putative disease resistance protein RGA3 [Humulus lupulus]|uniref:putative disease resistance protein RGA3 n=1 Tax=Humulus lupulus TaxID=3486 RepID=UPI002B403E45|nr:putative disease resistance protein RGA3 [Humulus lupulus]